MFTTYVPQSVLEMCASSLFGVRNILRNAFDVGHLKNTHTHTTWSDALHFAKNVKYVQHLEECLWRRTSAATKNNHDTRVSLRSVSIVKPESAEHASNSKSGLLIENNDRHVLRQHGAYTEPVMFTLGTLHCNVHFNFFTLECSFFFYIVLSEGAWCTECFTFKNILLPKSRKAASSSNDVTRLTSWWKAGARSTKSH